MTNEELERDYLTREQRDLLELSRDFLSAGIFEYSQTLSGGRDPQRAIDTAKELIKRIKKEGSK